MTPAEIDGLPAGRELDALVEEKVFKRAIHRVGGDPEYRTQAADGSWWSTPVPPRSTDIAAAWEVVEKLCRMVDGMGSSKPLALDFRHGGQWWCRVNTCEACVDVEADTAPLAICRAALKAMS